MEIMECTEAEGESVMKFTEIEAPIDSFDASTIFHVVNGVVGFVLYMHQQIPSLLEDITLEFEMLHMEYRELELVIAQEAKASSRRRHAGNLREIKFGIRRLEKLMKTVSSVNTALQLVISDIRGIHRVLLILGGSPMRPQHVYEICFSHENGLSGDFCDFAKSKAAEGLSRKAIRALISKGAGSSSYAGPSKLFLLIQAPTSFSLANHFLPKREFKYSRKIVPNRLRLKCKSQSQRIVQQNHDSEMANTTRLSDSSSNELIWFQCRHVIKGLASKNPSAEE